MRAFKRFDKRGFTLVELMIVVAIIGVLAALAIYGVRRYLASAKTSEAKNTVGAIARSAVQAYEREYAANELVADGAVTAAAMHEFCSSAANRVPTTTPLATKYQPMTAADKDFGTGDNTAGWRCLKFQMTQPIYYSYGYAKGQGVVPGSKADPSGFEVSAFGDLNGDGAGAVTPGAKIGTFARGAALRNNEVVLSSEIYIENEYE